MEKFENIQNSEQEEKYTSKIRLSFFRHGEKENDKSKSDNQIRLTENGRKDSAETSNTINIEQSVVFGSPRERTQETAALKMSGNQKEITGEETFEELKEKLDDGLHGVGSKIGVDKRLDFNLDPNSEFGKITYDNFKKGEYLKFLVQQSDKVAEETSDKTSFTYSRGASNIASIIEKYMKVAKKWDKLARDEQKEYSDTLERFLGTHQGVNESFVAKAIEMTKGVEERDKFVQLLNNQGFDFNEGFEVDILNKDTEEPVVHIHYKKEDEEGKEALFEFDEDLGIDLIKEIAGNNQ